ncbi:MAG: Gfo/Idh/MocA family oxidoreductase [Verrucomicrobiales bacterium]|nr:Gfo/Idh/MocA family oxidoreductase [Verrucomicrobiales bacterium]
MNDSSLERRQFVKRSAILAAAASAFPSGAQSQSEESEKIKVALIGCGGRGTGAAAQALAADDQTELFAMADISREQLDLSRETLKKNAPSPDQVTVSPENEFVGLEAYQRVMDLGDIDVVILTTPPGFRPFHFEAAVQAGKHVFMEKPVAVDAAGIRRVLESAKQAKAKDLKVGVGLNRRHSPIHKEVVSRIHDGVIGEIQMIQMLNCRGDVNKRRTRVEGQSELEFQIKNWYYFTWLSGDFMVEQSVHEFDVVRWVKDEAFPVSCQGQGGRTVRNGPADGHIYDHYSVDYEFADGSSVLTQHRQIPKVWSWFGQKIMGTNGSAELSFKMNGSVKPTGEGAKPFRGRETGNSYQLEHDALFNAIREGTEFNEAERGAYSTLFALMGRMAAYTGKVVTWEEALNSEEEIAFNPTSFDEEARFFPDENGIYETFRPGVT